MEQREKKTDFSIRTTFRKWLELDNLQNATLLFGNIAAGKTLICHLLNKFVGGVQDQNLKLVQKKKDFEYQYLGQINTKTTKPLTIYPKLFNIKKTDLNIIQVPSRIYTLQPKKRPYLDKLLNIVGLSHVTKNANFVFVVDSKNTSSKFQGWKKLFQYVFDSFKTDFLNQQTLKAVGFIVAKGASDITKQTYLNRMQDLHKLFTEEKHKNQYSQLLTVIQNKQNLVAFPKITKQNTQKDINEVYNLLKNLPKVPFQQITARNQPQRQSILQLQSIQLIKDEATLLNQFNECLKSILKFLTKIFNLIFSAKGEINLIKTISQDMKYQVETLGNQMLEEDEKCQNLWSNIVQSKYSQLLKISQSRNKFCQTTLGKSNFFIQFKQLFGTKRQGNTQVLKSLLKVLSNNGLILQLSQLKSVYLRLIEYSIFEERFGSFIQNIDYYQVLKVQNVLQQFTQNKQSSLKKLFISAQFSPDESPENAKLILNILDHFFPDQSLTKETQHYQKKAFLKNMMLLKKFDVTDPESDLPQIFKLLNEFTNVRKLADSPQKRAFSKKLAYLAAQMLKNHKRPDLCAEIFSKCGQYHSAKQCYQEMFNQKAIQKTSKQIKQIVLSYLTILQKMTLYEKALQKCYYFAEEYNQLRSPILEKMKDINKKRNGKQQFTKQFEEIFLNTKSQLIDFYVNNELLNKIKTVVVEIEKQKALKP